MSNEKPERVEIGSRWSNGRPWTVTKLCSGRCGELTTAYEPHAHFEQNGWQDTASMLSRPHWTYLGPSPGKESPVMEGRPKPAKGLEAGQRRVAHEKAADLLRGQTFTVVKCRGEHQWEYLYDNDVRRYFRDEAGLLAQSDLVADAPRQPALHAPAVPTSIISGASKPENNGGFVVTGIDWGAGIPVKREVSTNGRDWLDYNRLTDADPFSNYRHRRENGIVIAAVEPTGYGGDTLDNHRHMDRQRRAYMDQTDAIRIQKAPTPPAPLLANAPKPPRQRAYRTPSAPDMGTAGET